jgi:hypothetical protein
MKMAVMKLGNTPRPAAWSPLASFIPSTGVDPCNELIQLSPSSYGGGFLVNGVGRMVGSGSRRRRKLLKNRGGAMSKGAANRGKKGLGRSDRPVSPACFQPGSGPSFSPRLSLQMGWKPNRIQLHPNVADTID